MIKPTRTVFGLFALGTLVGIPAGCNLGGWTATAAGTRGLIDFASPADADAGVACGPEVHCGPFPDSGFSSALPVGPQPELGTTVVAALPPPPISGGTLLALGDGKTAVAADPDRDALYVVDLPSASVTFTVALSAGDEPGRLAEDGAGKVHVALRGAGVIATLDPATGTVITRRTVCPAPRGVAWQASTDLVWVACATGELVALPALGGRIARSSVVERDIRDVVLGPDDTIAVSTFRAAEILRLGPDGTPTRRDAMPAATLAGFDPQVAWRTIGGPGGTTLTVHQEHSIRSLSTTGFGGYGSGLSPESGAVVSMLTQMGSDGTVHGVASVNVVLPVDVALSPDGTKVAVLGAGDGLLPKMNSVFVIALANLAPASSLSVSATPTPKPNVVPSAVPQPPNPPAPVSLPTAGGNALPVPTGVRVIATAFDASGDVLVQAREPAALWVFDPDGNPLATIGLSTASRADTGHDVFHASAGALVACASCHPEGGDDGHVWLLDGQRRRTPSLRGTLVGTAPYHWPGDEANLATLVDDVYTRRMSGASLDSGQMSALEGWVQSIPAPRAPSWVDPSGAERGKALFASTTTGCATCHSGDKLTNNATVDVGTGGAFQVPPLVGVGWRTPLLHDGCAKTIAQRFGTCATLGHGTVASLSANDVADLTSYLETL